MLACLSSFNKDAEKQDVQIGFDYAQSTRTNNADHFKRGRNYVCWPPL